MQKSLIFYSTLSQKGFFHSFTVFFHGTVSDQTEGGFATLNVFGADGDVFECDRFDFAGFEGFDSFAGFGTDKFMRPVGGEQQSPLLRYGTFYLTSDYIRRKFFCFSTEFIAPAGHDHRDIVVPGNGGINGKFSGFFAVEPDVLDAF